MVSPADKQTIVASFLEVAVGQTTHTAHHFLQAANWVIEDALELFYVGNEGRVPTSSSYVPPVQHYVLLSDHNHSLLEDAKGNVCLGQGVGEDAKGNVCLGQGVGDEAHPQGNMDSDTPCSDEHIMTHIPLQPVPASTHIEVPMSNVSHIPGPMPCVSGQVVKRRRGRPRKTPLISGAPPLVVEPIVVVQHGLPPVEVSMSNISSVPVLMPCGSGQVVKRRRGRPRKTPLVVGTSPPVVEPALPPVEALVENLVVGSGCMPSTSAHSRRYKRLRQSHLATLGFPQLMPPRSKRTRSQIDAAAHTLGSSSQPKSVIKCQSDPVYKALGDWPGQEMQVSLPKRLC